MVRTDIPSTESAPPLMMGDEPPIPARPATALASVLLPEPDSPMTARISPSGIVNVTPLTPSNGMPFVRDEYRTERSSATTAFWFLAAALFGTRGTVLTFCPQIAGDES